MLFIKQYLQFFGIVFLHSGAAARFQQPAAAFGAHRHALYGFGLKENRPTRAVRLHEFDLHRSLRKKKFELEGLKSLQ